MCLNQNGNQVQVCTVGDLQPGQRYRDPEGNEFLIAEGHLVVNIKTGATISTLDWIGTGYRKDIKLGTDRQGRLYASRYLNPPQEDEVAARAPATPSADTQDPADIMRGNNPS